MTKKKVVQASVSERILVALKYYHKNKRKFTFRHSEEILALSGYAKKTISAELSLYGAMRILLRRQDQTLNNSLLGGTIAALFDLTEEEKASSFITDLAYIYGKGRIFNDEEEIKNEGFFNRLMSQPNRSEMLAALHLLRKNGLYYKTLAERIISSPNPSALAVKFNSVFGEYGPSKHISKNEFAEFAKMIDEESVDLDKLTAFNRAGLLELKYWHALKDCEHIDTAGNIFSHLSWHGALTPELENYLFANKEIFLTPGMHEGFWINAQRNVTRRVDLLDQAGALCDESKEVIMTFTLNANNIADKDEKDEREKKERALKQHIHERISKAHATAGSKPKFSGLKFFGSEDNSRTNSRILDLQSLCEPNNDSPFSHRA